MAFVEIDYVNWEGKRSNRRIIPLAINWASNQWHPECQWLLSAVDVDKNAIRYFAMKDILHWQELGGDPTKINPPLPNIKNDLPSSPV